MILEFDGADYQRASSGDVDGGFSHEHLVICHSHYRCHDVSRPGKAML